MREEPTKVYRILRRRVVAGHLLAPVEAEFSPYHTYTSYTGRPYISHASVKSVLGSLLNTQSAKNFEWKIEVSELDWKDIE